ncbi:MAG TPA: Ig-like domain-containing protein [Acidimicrobiales bacterium]|nr:Ig-like domain-containing protein [Acidimicrobiales bacterium]
MRRNGIIRGGHVALATLVATALTFGGVSSARADTVQADGDTVTVGLQTTHNLGTVAPGAVTTANVSFQLECATKKHVDDRQSVLLTFNSAGSTAPAGGSLSASQASIGDGDSGVPASWPEDGVDCPSSPLILSGGVSTVSVTAPTATGTYTYVARYIVGLTVPGSDDSSSITGSAPAITFTLTVAAPSDTTAPETAITGGPALLANSATAAFTFTSSEAGSTFACSLDGATEASCTSPKTYAGLSDGSHTFTVKATDAAGNPDASAASSTWTVDTTAPDTSITGGPATLVNTTGATFSFTSTEGSSTFACSLDGGPEALCTSPQSYSGLSQGSHTFNVKATDAAGNTDATPANSSWTVDSLAPDTTITANPAALANTTSAAFSFTSSETGGTFACSLDSAAYAPCSSPQSYTDLGQGGHTFNVKAADVAGNSDTTPASFTWTIDSVAPAVSTPDLVAGSDSGTSSTDDKTNDDTPTLAGQAEPGSTVALLRGGTVVDSTTASAAGDWQFTSTALTDGSYVFVARATDAAGNPASSDSLTVVVDTTAPGIAYFSRTATNTAGWNNTDVTVVWNCSDSSSGPTSLTVSATVSSEAAGQSATGTCTDLAGNTADDTQTGIKIDKTPPTVAYTSAAPAANGAGWHNVDVTATFTATDSLSGFTGGLTSTGTSVTTGEGSAVTAGSPAFTDLAGNTVAAANTSSDPFKIDKTAPAATPANVTSSTWRNTDLSQVFQFSDDTSGLAAGQDLGTGDTFTVTASAESASADAPTVASKTVTDVAGNSVTRTVSALIDKTAPAASPTDVIDTTWRNTPLSETFTFSDAQSGVAAGQDLVTGDTFTVTASAESASASSPTVASKTVTDTAGNSVTRRVSALIDTTAPLVTPDDVADTTWRNTSLSQAFAASDGLSGLAVPGDSSFTLTAASESSASAPTSESKTVRDVAGNSTTRSISALIDTSAPTATPDNVVNTTWRNTPLSQQFTFADAVSGLAPDQGLGAGGTATLTATADSADASSPTVVSKTVTDLAGNTVTRSVSALIDTAKPSGVAFVGGSVADGGSYYFGAVPALPASCTADDTLSGLQSCVVSGGGTSVGLKTITATATDEAGNVETARLTYNVMAWAQDGFRQPVDMAVTNLVKAGSTVPLKFEVFAGSTELSSLSTVSSFKVAQAPCGTAYSATDDIEVYSTGGTTLRYDSTGGQFIQNWQVPKVPANTCFRVVLSLADGVSSTTAFFKTK